MQQTTMALRHQNFMFAVRQQMGWPPFKPANDCLAFCAGRPMDIEIGMEIARIAQAMRKDCVYSGWPSTTAAEPEGFAVVIREMLKVDVIDHCVAWAADEKSPLMLVSTRGDECFAIGRRGLLERLSGKPKVLAKGKNLAMQRIHAAAAAMGDHLIKTNQWVPIGGKWNEPDVPLETVVSFT